MRVYKISALTMTRQGEKELFAQIQRRLRYRSKLYNERVIKSPITCKRTCAVHHKMVVNDVALVALSTCQLPDISYRARIVLMNRTRGRLNVQYIVRWDVDMLYRFGCEFRVSLKRIARRIRGPTEWTVFFIFVRWTWISYSVIRNGKEYESVRDQRHVLWIYLETILFEIIPKNKG